EGLAVSAKYRRHFRISDARRMSVLVGDTAAQPRAVVGHREKMRSVRRNAQGGDTAEGAIGRGQLQTAAKLERAEATSCWIAVIEGRDRLRTDTDLLDGRACAQRLCDRDGGRDRGDREHAGSEEPA